MANTATPPRAARAVRSVAHIPYAKPDWSDAQRLAWEAAQAIYAAKDALYHAFTKGALPSIEPNHRAWLAWMELERELEVTGLFSEEVK